MKVIYLDNNATTRTLPAVLEQMAPYFTETYGNASSIHTFGGKNKHAIEIARGRVASLLNANQKEIIFTSGGTESDNAAINSALKANPQKKHIITSAVEHPAVLEVCKDKAKQGYKVDFIGVDAHGRFDMQAFEKCLSGQTALVTVMHANSETGTIFPIKEITALAHKAGALMHTDAVQSVGKIPVDVKDLGVDMMSLSSHKINGPKGIGALYIKDGINFHPFMIGGHQEDTKRAGTEAVPNIVGFGFAAHLAKDSLPLYKTEVSSLRDILENGLLETIEDVKINGDVEHRLPNTTNLSFGYVEGESILMLLDEYGICASSGSACTSGSLEPSHVLRAMGVPFEFAHGSIRFSLGKETSQEDIKTVLRVMPDIIKKLRAISPFRKKACPR